MSRAGIGASCQPAEEDCHQSELKPSAGGGDGSLEVFCQPAREVEPAERPFNERLYNVAKGRSSGSVILAPEGLRTVERGR